MELYLLFQVGGAIGGFNTIMLIVVTGIVGAALAKSQGLSILTKIQTQMNRGELPADQIVQGLMVFAGGLLLVTPGIVTDIVGFLLVIPGSRHLLMDFVKKAMENAMKSGNVHFSTFSSAPGGGFSYTHYESHTADPFQQPRESISGDVFEAEYTKKE